METESLDIAKAFLRMQKDLLNEIKGLRKDLIAEKSDVCGPAAALVILGLNNKRLLTYFADELKILTRQPGGGSFLYYKEELQLLSKKIKSGDVIVPKIRHLRKK